MLKKKVKFSYMSKGLQCAHEALHITQGKALHKALHKVLQKALYKELLDERSS